MRGKLPALLLGFTVTIAASPRPATAQAVPAKVIFDTDIGDDIDDAYALAYLLRSPEVQVLGVTTAFRDTHLRARLATRLLKDAGHAEIPVYEGPGKPENADFSQRQYAEASPDRPYPDAIAFILDTIRKNPGQVTLVAVAPLTNVGALIARDPATFAKLKRVVLMGGAVAHGYGAKTQPEPEWNILNDIPAAQALFRSGVPLDVMPLDGTQIPLDQPRMDQIFAHKTALTNALQELTREWTLKTHNTIPTLFDVVAAVYAIHPEACPTTPMRIEVTSNGLTQPVPGKPNTQVCLHPTPNTLFPLLLPRLF